MCEVQNLAQLGPSALDGALLVAVAIAFAARLASQTAGARLVPVALRRS